MEAPLRPRIVLAAVLAAGIGLASGAPPAAADRAPGRFAKGRVDVTTIIRTARGRRPISPLIYGVNVSNDAAGLPPRLAAAVSFVRRGGDRSNAYDWETNVSSGAFDNDWANDMFLADGLPDQNAPAGVDLRLIGENRAAGRGSMVPFVLNDYVAGPVASDIPWDTPTFDREPVLPSRAARQADALRAHARPRRRHGLHRRGVRLHARAVPGHRHLRPGTDAGHGRHRQRARPLAPELPDAPGRARRSHLREQRRPGRDAGPR